MKQALVRYAVCNLSDRSFSIKEAAVPPLGGWHSLMLAASDIWERDAGAIMLATGPLCGTGVWGSGSMTWVLKNGERYQARHSAGRLGAALRGCGVRGVVFTGKSDFPLRITADDTGFYAEEQPKRLRYKELLLKRPDENACIAVVNKKSIVEEGVFGLASAKISRLLHEKGVRSIILSGGYPINIADAERYLDAAVSLTGLLNAITPNCAGCAAPARYLSSFEYNGKDCGNLADIGLMWGGIGGNDDAAGYAAELASAAIGEEFSKWDIMRHENDTRDYAGDQGAAL